jgi:hypothetical protein
MPAARGSRACRLSPIQASACFVPTRPPWLPLLGVDTRRSSVVPDARPCSHARWFVDAEVSRWLRARTIATGTCPSAEWTAGEPKGSAARPQPIKDAIVPCGVALGSGSRRGRCGGRRGLTLVLGAPGEEADDQQDDDRADDPSEVEHLRVADAEPDREDQVAEGGASEADEQRDTP